VETCGRSNKRPTVAREKEAHKGRTFLERKKSGEGGGDERVGDRGKKGKGIKNGP